MSDADENVRAVWDPTAHGGAGGWVRRGAPAPQAPAQPPQAPALPPQAPPVPEERNDDPQRFLPADGLPPLPPLPSGPIPSKYSSEEAPVLPEGLFRDEAGPQLTKRPPTNAGAGAGADDDAPLPERLMPPRPPSDPGAPTALLPPVRPLPEPPYAAGGLPPVRPLDGPGPGPGYLPPQLTPEPEEPGARRALSGPALVGLVVVVAIVLGVGAVYGLGLGGSKHHDPLAAPAPTPTSGTGSNDGTGGSAPGQQSGGTAAASPSSDAAAQGQAQAVDTLLAKSANSRQQVIDAVAAVDQCTDSTSVAAAQGQLQQAAEARTTQAQQAGQLDVSQLPSSAKTLMGVLKQAWTESADADASYAKWAAAMSGGGCTPNHAAHTADYNAAVASSDKATTDKQSFVLQWNQIANQYGLPSRTADAL